MPSRSRFLLGSALTASVVALVTGPAAPVSAAVPDRVEVRGAGQADAVPDRYIVVMRPGAPGRSAGNAIAEARRAGGRIRFTYDATISGFAATLPAPALRRVAANPDVAYIEADQRVRLSGTQSGPTWGLDRIDQRTLPLSGSYSYGTTGAGVTAYVIDTGIRSSHSDFGGRIAAGYTAISDGQGTNDCNGHGTHVAGTVGGSTYGVAKGVTLRPVRVLDCNGAGTTSGVIAGVDWVTANRSGPSVANMSLGGGASTSLDAAVQRSIDSGVTYAVAAGNANVDACTSSPARVGPALTVGASTSADSRSSFSNFGACLDLFAPGSGIGSAWYTGDTATNTLSGTSMASPHVAGVAALYLATNPAASPATVAGAMVNGATGSVLSNVGAGSPNKLLHSVLAAGATPPPGNLLTNPGFESGNTVWSAGTGVISRSTTTNPSRTGSWKAWLGGDGVSRTEAASQPVALPATASSATLKFWLRIQTAETTTSVVNDRLRVQVIVSGVTSTLRTYSNLNRNSTYAERTVDLSAYRGKQVTLRFLSTESSTKQTSFLVDDTKVITG